MFRPVLTVGSLTLAAAILTGCSLAAPPAATSTPTAAAESGQTVAEACDEILPAVLDMTSRLNDAYAELQTDPAAASPLLHDVSDDLHAAIDELENDEVVTVMTTAVESLDTMIVEIDKAIAGDPDQAALLAAATQTQADFTAVDPVCQAG